MSTVAEPRAALTESVAALRRLADYTLPTEFDRRMLELGERKESLSTEERAELLAWVRFSQERSVEKFGAVAALQRLTAAFPELALPT